MQAGGRDVGEGREAKMPRAKPLSLEEGMASRAQGEGLSSSRIRLSPLILIGWKAAPEM